MTRRPAVIALVAATLGAAAGCGGNGGGGRGGYRVDVIFDTASGLLPGQLVKVAGSRSGEIVDVRLTRDFKARVELRVDPAFAPFRRDARCTIQPEGLIGENFVACDPGRRGAPLRPTSGDGPPTLPVERTAVPVSFPDLFNLATAPVSQRLSIVVGSLGLALAGRGEQLNGILRRAAPVLGDVRALARVLDRQRAALDRAVANTDAVLGAVGRRRGALAAIARDGARVTAQTAARRGALAASLRGLPRLLADTRQATTRLTALMRQGTPLLADVEASAPQLRRVVDELVPASRAAGPALRDLGDVAVTARRTATRSATTVRLLRRFAGKALPVGAVLDRVLRDLRGAGAIDNSLLGFYNVAALTARYDATSHLLPLRVTLNSCSVVAKTPGAGCDAHVVHQQAPATARRRRPAARRPGRGTPPAAAPTAAATPDRRTPSAAPTRPATGIPAVDRLLDALAPRAAPDPDRDSGLLDFLLG